MTLNDDIDRARKILELALYHASDDTDPRDIVTMAAEVHDRLRRYELLTDHLITALASLNAAASAAPNLPGP